MSQPTGKLTPIAMVGAFFACLLLFYAVYLMMNVSLLTGSVTALVALGLIVLVNGQRRPAVAHLGRPPGLPAVPQNQPYPPPPSNEDRFHHLSEATERRLAAAESRNERLQKELMARGVEVAELKARVLRIEQYLAAVTAPRKEASK